MLFLHSYEPTGCTPVISVYFTSSILSVFLRAKRTSQLTADSRLNRDRTNALCRIYRSGYVCRKGGDVWMFTRESFSEFIFYTMTTS